MGRIKAAIPFGSFWLRPSTNQKGETPVYVRYFVNGKYIKKSTNIFINPDDWDDKKQVVKSKNKQAATLNGKLNAFKQKIDEQLLSFRGTITYKVVDMILNGSSDPNDKTQGILFKQYADKLNDLMYSRNSYGYSVYYNNTCNLNQFDRFVTAELGIPALKLTEINMDLINKFVEYKRNRKGNKSIEGINHCLTPIIRTVKYARDNGLLDAIAANPIINDGYLSVKDRSYNPDLANEKKIHYLTQEQLHKFMEYKPRSNSKERTLEIMDIFMFSYYACGLRISDLATLEWSNIDFKNRKIDKVQVKTKMKGKVPPTLPQPAIDILMKWKAKNRNKRFVFDLLPEDWTFGDNKESDRKLKMRLNSIDNTFNTSLGDIGKKLGFKFPLTIHVARHTFCVTALNHGVSLHVVSQLMGHACIQSTEKTYAEFLDETVSLEMSKLEQCF
jgi:integrase